MREELRRKRLELVLIGLGTLVGWWACTRTAQHLGLADPGAIVWDEVIAFWLILWLVMPAGLVGDLLARALAGLWREQERDAGADQAACELECNACTPDVAWCPAVAQ